MKYLDKCRGCNQQLYGPVNYCPFCGTELTTRTTAAEIPQQPNPTAVVEALPEQELEETVVTKQIEPKKVEGFAEDSEPFHKEEEPFAEQSVLEEEIDQGSQKVEQKDQEKVRQKKNNLTRIIMVLIILAVGYFIYTNFIGKSQFISKIDRAIAERRYFSPADNNVADFIRAKKASAPNSPEVQEAISIVRRKLEPVGNDAFQRLYAESIDTDWDNVVNIYKLLKEIIPDDRDIAAKSEFSQAHQIIKARGGKNYVDVLSHYQKALELKPDWVLAINGIAKVYVRKDSPYYNKEEALNWYGKASKTDPNFPWAYTNIAAIYMEDKQWNMAEQALLNALKIKNNSASIFTEIGKACEKQQKGQDAKNYYQEAMKYEKDSDKVAWLQKKISAIQ